MTKKIRTGTVLCGIGVLVLLAALFVFSSLLPAVAIRKHFFRENPAQALTCRLTKTPYANPVYGLEYKVDGFTDPVSENEINFAYVRQGALGLYYWTGSATGP